MMFLLTELTIFKVKIISNSQIYINVQKIKSRKESQLVAWEKLTKALKRAIA